MTCFLGYHIVDGRCLEACGDGMNYGELECDDGN